jgi:cell division protein FtsQ
MNIHINWQKVIIVALDLGLAVYLMIAFTAFNKPDETARLCTKVNISIEDEAANGFIDTKEIKNRLEHQHLYPFEKPMKYVDARKIEETLMASPFVKTAECYKTQDGQVNISLTQRMPIVRIKAINGDDYYLDDHDCVMPNSHYTSDLIIATGHISKWFATNYISPMSKTLMTNDLWKNQIEQINVLPNQGIELIPRVGNHIIYIGQLPLNKYKNQRSKLTTDFISKKMERLEKFYKYGLSQAGWNKYCYINLEFDNQIICKKKESAVTDNI